MSILDKFFQSFFDESPEFNKRFNDIEESIKASANAEIKKEEYEENGMKITKESYSNKDGTISWSRTTYNPSENKETEIKKLEESLKEAIEKQDFEQAAYIRDMIKTLKIN